MLTRWLSPQNPQAAQQNFVFDKNNRVVSKPQAVENQFEIRNYELGIVDAVLIPHCAFLIAFPVWRHARLLQSENQGLESISKFQNRKRYRVNA